MSFQNSVTKHFLLLFLVTTFVANAGSRERQILTDSLNETVKSSTHRLPDGTGLIAMVIKTRDSQIVLGLVAVDKEGSRVADFVSNSCETIDYQVTQSKVNYQCVESISARNALNNTYEVSLISTRQDFTISNPRLVNSRAAMLTGTAF